MRRVVVTGLGMVVPGGNSVEQAWKRVLSADSAVGSISLFDASEYKVQIAAEVKGLDTSNILDPKDERRMTRFIKFAAAAAQEAMDDAGLNGVGNPERQGCAIGVGMGGLGLVEESTALLNERGEKRISPFVIPYIIPNMAAGYVSIRHKLRGPNICPATACASGTHAIGEGFQLIQDGKADVMLCGGSESTISPLGIAAFTACKALSQNNDNPKQASRPFDRNRDGFVMGEGAALLVLEELEHAKQRNAKIYAEVVGFGLTGDGFHITAPPEGAEGGLRAMRMALDSAGLKPDQVDYINAHGTSTKLNDQYESEAIMTLFGDRAKDLHISSTKGVTGHCIGAAGGVEAAFSVLSLYNNVVPPTANYSESDPLCPLNYTPNDAIEVPIGVVLSNSFGFGGTNASIALKKFS
jgi:3-oxoacyl-[acyl-carrier-protein] synthase II